MNPIWNCKGKTTKSLISISNMKVVTTNDHNEFGIIKREIDEKKTGRLG